MNLKKLIFYNRNRKKIVLIVGRGIFTDFAALILNKLNIDFKYLKLKENCDLQTVDFFEPIYIPEFLINNLDFFNKKNKDLKYSFYFNNNIFPVINNLEFFRECFTVCFKEEFNLDLNALTSEQFKKVILSILYFYNYPLNLKLKKEHIDLIKNNFFSPNICCEITELGNILNRYTGKSNVIEVDKLTDIEQKKKSLIINGQVYNYDILITDLKKLIKPKKIIKTEQNTLEFKINKDYTTEYFPKIMIFDNEEFYKMELIEDSRLRKFKVYSFDTIDIDFIYNFFKNFFPDLKDENILVEKKEKVIYENFRFKNELQPFNLISKITEVKNFFENRF